ncbi:hypothetical protein PUN28_005158 [Cardiocondyla obscurior]|uniref:Uncharacterized protein n=1 Tax=Cardiocondyla obscurior TaxID=286306 RepID=A0AAW2GKC9_9HYME
MEEPRKETEREALLFGRTPAKGEGLSVKRGKKKKKKKKEKIERETERENGRLEHVARFTPSYNLCSYCLRGKNLSLCRSLNTHIPCVLESHEPSTWATRDVTLAKVSHMSLHLGRRMRNKTYRIKF